MAHREGLGELDGDYGGEGWGMSLSARRMFCSCDSRRTVEYIWIIVVGNQYGRAIF